VANDKSQNNDDDLFGFGSQRLDYNAYVHAYSKEKLSLYIKYIQTFVKCSSNASDVWSYLQRPPNYRPTTESAGERIIENYEHLAKIQAKGQS